MASLGRASLVGNVLRAKIGGRVSALALPDAEAQRVVQRQPAEQRRLRAPPADSLELEPLRVKPFMGALEPRHAYGYTEHAQNVCDVGGGSYVYSVASLAVVWDEERKEQRFFQEHSDEVTALAFCAKTRLMASGQKFVGADSGAIRLWPVDTAKQKSQVLGHHQSVYSLAFSVDGQWLFSIAAADQKSRSRSRSAELRSAASPLCAWRVEELKAKPLRAAQVRLAVKETLG